MIPRHLTPVLRHAITQSPVVTLTGPRQSGKTTLLRRELRRWRYVSLEDPDIRVEAIQNPRQFLRRDDSPLVIDEAQRVPDLFSYIQGVVDERGTPGQYVLSGSHDFLLLQSISQSLAGRTRILHLLPFSISELDGRAGLSPGSLGSARTETPHSDRDLFATLHAGCFPPIHDRKLAPREWLADYYQTYLVRDVRDVLKIGDLEAFDRFVRLCAARVGQLLNLSSLGADCGVSHVTAKRWLSVLVASFQVTLLRPFFGNLGKRFIRSPKLYFLDTGLLCYLLGVRESSQLATHPLRGSIFESHIVAELTKSYLHRGEEPRLTFWRDARGHEVDVVVDEGQQATAIEIKSGRAVADGFFEGLRHWRRLPGRGGSPCAVVYGGDEASERDGIVVYPWRAL